jgi:hypothetical protein
VSAVLYEHFIGHGSDSIRSQIEVHQIRSPIRTPSVVNLRLISVSTQTIIDRKETLRWISKKWSSLLSDASDPFRDPEDPLHPQANRCRFENYLVDIQLVRGQLPLMLLLTWGVSFTFTFAVHLYWESSGGSFTEIAMVRLLRGCSTILKNLASSRAFFGVTHISIVTSADSILLSQSISSRYPTDLGYRKVFVR